MMTERQNRFVREYLADLNATQAAIRAGYSPRSAKVRGCLMLAMPEISAAIGKAMAERSKRTEIKADDVIAMLIECYHDARGEAEYGPAIRAAELLGKHFGLFADRHEHTGKDGGPIEIEDARERLIDGIAGIASRLGAGGAGQKPH